MAALGGQQQELDLMLAALAPRHWERPSRCPGWTIADVVLHLAQTDEMVVAIAEGRWAEAVAGFSGSSVDDAAGRMVEEERGATGPVVHSRWRAAAEAERALLSACDASQRLPWVVGDLPARTLATTRLAETWIHTGDVAWALGIQPPPTERLWHIARLAWRTLPYAFARSGQTLRGPVTLELTAPDGTTWSFGESALTTVRGSAEEFCLVAGRRLNVEETSLVGEGPDAESVLALVRTFA